MGETREGREEPTADADRMAEITTNVRVAWSTGPSLFIRAALIPHHPPPYCPQQRPHVLTLKRPRGVPGPLSSTFQPAFLIRRKLDMCTDDAVRLDVSTMELRDSILTSCA